MSMLRATRRVSREGRDNGASAVEAALLIPVVLLIAFGIIDFSLLLRDHVSVTSAVRAGARVASAEPRVPGVYDPATGAPASLPALAQDAADAIQRAGSAMPKDSIDELWVYEADSGGYPKNSSGTFNSCSSNCVKFRWVDATNKFQYTSGTWNYTSINACPGDANAQAVGVYVKATHKFIFASFFGASAGVADHAVMKFEPIPTSQVCK
jgi:Flp pilus assembly protein TadG